MDLTIVAVYTICDDFLMELVLRFQIAPGAE